jgi:hypothetical protein
MEFLFELLFEFFGEVILQVLFQALAEAGLHMVKKPDAPEKKPNPWLLSLGYATLGAIVGGVSLLIHPGSLIQVDWLRKVNLVLGPVAGGLGMAWIGALRKKRGQTTIQLDRFTYGFVFSFGMTAVRYLWTH